MKHTDNQILHLLTTGKTEGLKHLYDIYFMDLFRFSVSIVIQKEIAEEIVQDVFILLWEKRKSLAISKSLKAYLFTAVRNHSINYTKSAYGKTKFEDISSAVNQPRYSISDNQYENAELKLLIQNAILSLPQKCKIIFNLSRNAGMTYQEIAEDLDISKRTVQTQIGIAIKKIREYLGNRWDDVPG